MGHAELETLVQGKTIEEITLRVYGGTDHLDRLEIAGDWIHYFEETGEVVSCDSYECTAKKDDSGNGYTEFRYFCSPTNTDVTTN